MKRLNGWKEIASHLNHGVRTAQRWEVLGLPIHRMGAGKGPPVIAFVEEVDQWTTAAPVRQLDVIADLKSKVQSLELEVASLKRALQREKTGNRATQVS